LVTLTAARIRAALDEGALLAPLTANVTPLQHQLAALRRALESRQSRLLLADEVGLRKTIEPGRFYANSSCVAWCSAPWSLPPPG
jgi:hypothetical protein